jgi:hypothetical protein
MIERCRGELAEKRMSAQKSELIFRPGACSSAACCSHAVIPRTGQPGFIDLDQSYVVIQSLGLSFVPEIILHPTRLFASINKCPSYGPIARSVGKDLGFFARWVPSLRSPCGEAVFW